MASGGPISGDHGVDDGSVLAEVVSERVLARLPRDSSHEQLALVVVGHGEPKPSEREAGTCEDAQ